MGASRDVDSFTGSWISTDASREVDGPENTEVAEFDPAISDESVDELLEELIDDLVDMGLGKTSGNGNTIDEMTFGHGVTSRSSRRSVMS